MEHPPAHTVTRKRKASQSSPIQDPRCIPQDDTSPSAVSADVNCSFLRPSEQPPTEGAIVPPPSDTLFDADSGEARRPKRLRLSITSSASHTSTRRTTPPRKRASPRSRPPSPAYQESHLCPAPWVHHQSFRLHRLHRHVSLSGTLLSPLDSPATPSPVAPPQIFIPPLRPTITRDTLRELDLDAILRNPQLRHDLLFDPRLQFRPTTGRRKQLAADRYWVAVTRELECGCACAAWDAAGVLLPCQCEPPSASNISSTAFDSSVLDGPWMDRIGNKAKRTRPPTPPPWSDRYATYLEAAADPRLHDARAHGDTERTKESEEEQSVQIRPSRVGPMLHELVAVLACVIVPPPLPTLVLNANVNPLPPRPSLPSSISDAHHLLAHLDPSLMEQELRRGIFDPAGLFELVGDTLKRHCAPMRDRLVDGMVGIAKGGEGTVVRAIVAMKMCFEVLELMKLDIANHQLQHLRPYLATSTPDFELRVFAEECRRGASPRIAREWLQKAWAQTRAGPLPAGFGVAVHKACSSRALGSSAGMDVGREISTVPRVRALPRRTLVQLSLINAVTGLVFNLPSHPSNPETLYLDAARVALLAADAADVTALYMLLMLWRQLVFWTPTSAENDHGDGKGGVLYPRYARTTPKLDDWEVDRMKREIWEVGPQRIGSCFFFPDKDEITDAMGEDREKWMHAIQGVAVQIAMRAEEARTRTSSGPTPPAVAATARRPPSQEALDLMSGWIQSHMRRGSVLACRLRELLRHQVVEAVVRMTFAGGVDRDKSIPGPDSPSVGSGGGTAGLEPLMPEIRHLAQRLSKLVLVNMRVYWSLYEAEGFLADDDDL